MADHEIKAHFVVKVAAVESQALEDRIVAEMVKAMADGWMDNFKAIRLDHEARTIYRAVTAMHEALAKEQG